MTSKISRREVLKLGGLLPLSFYLPTAIHKPGALVQNPDAPNVLIIVFDALSAANVSLYGYPRQTTPNFSRLAQRATVFHNHYASGTFTFPGTASLLSGLYPWTHRAFFWDQQIPKSLRGLNIFNLFQDYYSLSYTHNNVAEKIIRFYLDSIDHYLPPIDLYINPEPLIESLFSNDPDIAEVSWIRLMNKKEYGSAYSLFLSEAYRTIVDQKIKTMEQSFPRGLPYSSVGKYYLLETAIDWTVSQLNAIPQPFLGYFHYFPPHHPYNTPQEYFNIFKGDGFSPLEKPEHILGNHKGPSKLLNQRRSYDEFIPYADAQFGRLFTDLENSGILDNTWLILTSDHGHMFERGFFQHQNKSMHQPIVKIPLMVFEPGQSQRRDVVANTNAVDILPTLLHLTNREIPAWVEGEVLPPYMKTPAVDDRSMFSFDSKKTPSLDPIQNGSAAIVKGPYKLIYFFGFEELHEPGLVELYNLTDDPQELNDLSKTHRSLAADLLNELKTRLNAADAPYQRKS